MGSFRQCRKEWDYVTRYGDQRIYADGVDGKGSHRNWKITRRRKQARLQKICLLESVYWSWFGTCLRQPLLVLTLGPVLSGRFQLLDNVSRKTSQSNENIQAYGTSCPNHSLVFGFSATWCFWPERTYPCHTASSAAERSQEKLLGWSSF